MMTFKKILFNLTFYPFFVLITAVMFAVFLPLLLLMRAIVGERKALHALRGVIYFYGFIIVRVLAFPFMRIEYKDYEKGKDSGPCVYVCNHRSSSDAFLMVCLNREVVQVVNNWPFKIPILGWVARCAGYLSIRTMTFEDFSKKASELLAEGVSIVAFPEGSRSTHQTMNQFNGAVFRIAQAARVPIVPLCVSGNEKIPERSSYILNPGTVKIRKLPALKWESFENFTPFKLKNQVREMIQAEFDKVALP